MNLKNIKLSLLVCVLVSAVLVQYRVNQPSQKNDIPLNVLSWDAFGYYMFLPGIFLYDDITSYDWVKQIDEKYNATGGHFYQGTLAENGNYVGKYFGGVAILEIPFFFVGHLIAVNSHYQADGFSPPYQYSIAFGAIFYCILALFLLRKILLRYYSEPTTALTILLLVMATNFIQYVAIDSAQSHAFIFPLYVLVIYFTDKWHRSSTPLNAAITGLIIGSATICRPTEAIMVFIPILWNTHNKEASAVKWALVKKHLKHVYIGAFFGLIGILPQLIYWKTVSGDWVFNVGSKWYFLNPFFRVIVGFENGWMVYTPITIFFVLGFLFIKRFPFRKSVIVFCLLNIWIITAWSDWKYGATYSTRALVQSYPVFALAFAAVIDKILAQKWRALFLILGGYLIFVNLFQMEQYYKTILHYRDMNRQYYGRIYLNSNPTPLDMSLMDTDEVLTNPEDFKPTQCSKKDSTVYLVDQKQYTNSIAVISDLPDQTKWLHIKVAIAVEAGFGETYLVCKLLGGSDKKERKVRLFNPISQAGNINDYEFYVEVPEGFNPQESAVYFLTGEQFTAQVAKVELCALEPAYE